MRILIIEKESEIINPSHDSHQYLPAFTPLEKGSSGIREKVIHGEKMRYHYQYFPFWRWHIVSLMSEKSFLGQLLKIERVVILGNLDVLSVVLLSVTILFYWRVNLPLKRIIGAACGVGRGELSSAPGKDGIQGAGTDRARGEPENADQKVAVGMPVTRHSYRDRSLMKRIYSIGMLDSHKFS